MKLLKSAVLTAALTTGTGAEAEPIFTGQQVGLYAGYVSEDLAATRAFFEQKLGFKPLFESDWFVLLALEGNQIAFLKPEQEGQAPIFRRAYPGHGAWITFSVPNVDEVHRRAEGAGIPIAVPLRDEPWGERHFSVVAPGGLALDFVTYQGPLAQ
ncbi:VOC family protein [Dongia deserti]|uniref:VOC family protein n=1 Tax=Dongia deserti TaxID=2268030 RepID=UPI0013C4CF7B|nr:VOC family protein [Dongia deserti]